ncbi:hypothetical protein CCE28_05000 [Anaeromicrobium sediminis]|uniref:Uncharacterized protein n=2 Tax=Anaeromicrobium sediminis TaxID=1478221 RepID=A0A267MND4_9FIRM|nr:hypothetical protein CCE28_05000 [Anaeromicrobium sediminis]
MGLVFQTANITNGQGFHIFTFDADIISSQVFIKGFNVQYPSGDHHVAKIEVDTTQIVMDPRRIKVQVIVTMTDNSGNHQDNSSSFVEVVVVAVLQDQNNYLMVTEY